MKVSRSRGLSKGLTLVSGPLVLAIHWGAPFSFSLAGQPGVPDRVAGF